MTPHGRFAFLLLAAIVLLSPAPAAALPSFARANSAPCATCHSTPPRLNAYGTRWLLAGDRAPGALPLAAAHPASTVSLIAELGATVQRTAPLDDGIARATRSAPQFRPYALGLHGAGLLTRSLGYGAEAAYDSARGPVRAPVLFARLVGVAGGAGSVTVGRFEAGLPFLSSNRRGTLTPFRAPVSIAAEGIELSAAQPGWAAALGRTDSERSQDHPARLARSLGRIEDTYAWGQRSFAGQAIGARMLFARQASDISWHAWLQRLQGEIGGSFGTDRLRLEPAWVLDRFDDRPIAGEHQRHQYAVLQGLARCTADGSTAIAFRFEHEHLTPTPSTRGEDHDLEVLRLTRALSPGMRVALEGAHTGDNVGGPHTTRIYATVTLAY